MTRQPIVLRCLVGATLLVGASCSGLGQGPTEAGTEDTPIDAGPGIAAEVASFDLDASGPQRFMIGLFDADLGLLSHGSIDLAFEYLGTRDETIEPDGTPEMSASASFVAVPGSEPVSTIQTPTFDAPGGVRGVYATEITFDEPGFWSVTVTIPSSDAPVQGEALFEVAPEGTTPEIGEPAPRTVHPLRGDDRVPIEAVDSRATESVPLPDPELHHITIADAIARRRPVMIVVSTPVFCASQFCGPITDAVSRLANDYADTADFVHLEVWRDYEDNQLNTGALEWIWPSGEGEPGEPWVFLVDDNGTVIDRWDNVAPENELRAALDRLDAR